MGGGVAAAVAIAGGVAGCCAGAGRHGIGTATGVTGVEAGAGNAVAQGSSYGAAAGAACPPLLHAFVARWNQAERACSRALSAPSAADAAAQEAAAEGAAADGAAAE